MKLTKQPTLHRQFVERMNELWKLHKCNSYCGDISPMSKVLEGEWVLVTYSYGPVMVVKYVDKAVTRWFFDAYGK